MAKRLVCGVTWGSVGTSWQFSRDRWSFEAMGIACDGQPSSSLQITECTLTTSKKSCTIKVWGDCEPSNLSWVRSTSFADRRASANCRIVEHSFLRVLGLTTTIAAPKVVAWGLVIFFVEVTTLTLGTREFREKMTRWQSVSAGDFQNVSSLEQNLE